MKKLYKENIISDQRWQNIGKIFPFNFIDNSYEVSITALKFQIPSDNSSLT